MEQIPPFVLKTTDSQGTQHHFNVKLESESAFDFEYPDRFIRHNLSIESVPLQQDGEVYQFTLIEYNDGLIRVNLMENKGRAAYYKKGMTPVILDWASKHFCTNIESSTNNKNEKRLGKNQRRSDQASEVW